MCQIIGLGFLVRHSTAETGFPPGGLERGRESRPVTTSQQTKGTENTKLLRIQMDLGKQINNPISVGILFQASLPPLQFNGQKNRNIVTFIHIGRDIQCLHMKLFVKMDQQTNQPTNRHLDF